MPRKNINRNASNNQFYRRGNRDSGRIASGPPPLCPDNAPVLHALLDGLDVGVANVSSAGNILYANSRFAEMLRANPDQLRAGALLIQFISPASWPALRTAIADGMARPTRSEMRIANDRGVFRTIQLSLAPMCISGEPRSVMIAATEVTELVQKNKALQATEETLHSLSARILQLQDQERRRIARDLHDITGQELAVIVMSLNQLARHWGHADVDAHQALSDCVGLVRTVEDEIRTLSYLLHPPLLDEFGLRSALNWYVDGFTKRSGIAVAVKAPRNFPRLSIEKETALFRVVQESLTNVLRHSHSSRARIRLWLRAGEVHLSVDDEGKGISREALAKISEGTSSGVGSLGMRERLQQLGGSLHFRPRPKGTQVVAVVPVASDETPAADFQRPAESFAQPEPLRPATLDSKRRILIADDHEVTRQGIKSLLKDDPSVEICGEAQDGHEAIAKAREMDPDLIIMDISMPGASGFAAARAIRDSGARAKIFFFTTYTHPETERNQPPRRF